MLAQALLLPSSKVSADHPAGAADPVPHAAAHRPEVPERAAVAHRRVAGLVADRDLHPVHAGHEALVVAVARRELDAPRAGSPLQTRLARGGVAVLVGDLVRQLHRAAALLHGEAQRHRLDVADDVRRDALPREVRRPRVDLDGRGLERLLVQRVVDRVERDRVLAVVGVVLGGPHHELVADLPRSAVDLVDRRRHAGLGVGGGELHRRGVVAPARPHAARGGHRRRDVARRGRDGGHDGRQRHGRGERRGRRGRRGGRVGDAGRHADDARQGEAGGGDEDEQMAIHGPSHGGATRGGPAERRERLRTTSTILGSDLNACTPRADGQAVTAW